MEYDTECRNKPSHMLIFEKGGKASKCGKEFFSPTNAAGTTKST